MFFFAFEGRLSAYLAPRFFYYYYIVCFFFNQGFVKIVNLHGKLKSSKKLASELSFDFCIESVGEQILSLSLIVPDITISYVRGLH